MRLIQRSDGICVTTQFFEITNSVKKLLGLKSRKTTQNLKICRKKLGKKIFFSTWECFFVFLFYFHKKVGRDN